MQFGMVFAALVSIGCESAAYYFPFPVFLSTQLPETMDERTTQAD
jgi:hypothetical protein